MCRPKLANVMSSGWHLHQSLTDRKTHANAFVDATEPLSATGRHYMAGLLEHARAAAAFSTPTLNGYKRYRPFSLAPDRAIWGRDNRGVMVRVLGGPGDPATHLENRVGEPAANPYLYMASQIVCGLDGLERKLDPGPSADTPYEAKAPLLPRSLGEALAALNDNKVAARRARRLLRRLLSAPQAGRDRPLRAGGQRLGAAGVFLPVLEVRADPHIAGMFDFDPLLVDDETPRRGDTWYPARNHHR